ncbi:MAG: hypothetical protein E7K17_05325 [Klebsiella michiganensis]|nr:hypothetical protein [Klebsiella michiganensis]
MTQHHWAPGADIIDIRFTINVVKVSAVGALDKQRRTADAGLLIARVLVREKCFVDYSKLFQEGYESFAQLKQWGHGAFF